MLRLFRLLAPFFLLPGPVLPVFAQTDLPPQVVVTIKPLHALVGGIMKGAGEPVLLIDGSMSPHGYRLTPADARRLETADLVIWIGPSLESKLARPLRNLVPGNSLLSIGAQPRLTRLPAREGGAWTDHEHDGTHEGAPDHHYDSHVWLDPLNAKAIIDIIARRLQQLDPANTEVYAGNTRHMQARIDALDLDIAGSLSDVKNVPYLVFHDALQYFEHRYSLSPAGTLTIDPERTPGARRLLELRQLIREREIRCVFHEPQFGTKVVDVLLEDTGAKLVTLDPLGFNVPGGFDGYLQLLQQLADDMRGCLAGK